MTGFWSVFNLLRRTVDEKHLMRFQSEKIIIQDPSSLSDENSIKEISLIR